MQPHKSTQNSEVLHRPRQTKGCGEYCPRHRPATPCHVHTWRIDHRTQSYEDREIMKNLNVKTRKGGVLAGAVMALTTATVLAMAPTSQAFAANVVSTGGVGGYSYYAQDTNTNSSTARQNVINKALDYCYKKSKRGFMGQSVRIAKRGRLYYATLPFNCAR